MSAIRASIVIAESDQVVAGQLIRDAHRVGIATTWCRDAAEALLTIGAIPPHALVVGARSETLDASQVTAAVRSRSRLPILVGVSPGEEGIAQGALALGASAVVSRPYDIAAIAPFLAGVPRADDVILKTYAAGPIFVDRRLHEANVAGRAIHLTHLELELLVFLIEKNGAVASREEISRAVWGHVVGTNTVAVHVKRLREKLGYDDEHGRYIRTVRGAGYRLASTLCS